MLTRNKNATQSHSYMEYENTDLIELMVGGAAELNNEH
jgi:hypothetical protein